MATREELITLFGDDFGEVLVGLDQLPKEVLELLDSTMNNMLFDADVFTNRIAKTVGTQTSAGVATSSIEDILANDMGEEGRIFGELRNTVKESLVEGINQTSRAGAFQAYDPDEDTLFTWVTVAGHRICKDCLPRGGERKTLRDWEAAGVPASGWSICGGYCYCILDPSGKISPRVQLEEREGGLKIQEKGATARPKPKKIATKKTTRDISKNLLPQERMENFTNTNELPKHLQKHATGSAFLSWSRQIAKKYGVVNFKGISKANMAIIAEALEDTLGRYDIKVDHLGLFKRNMKARNAGAAAWGRGDGNYVIGWKRDYVTNHKKYAEYTNRSFLIKKEKQIERQKRTIARIEKRKKEGTIRGNVEKLLKDEKDRLKMLQNKHFNKYSTSSSVKNSLYATSKHECWHQIDYQLSKDGVPLCGYRGGNGGLFQQNLKKYKVDRMEWYQVSEYAGSSIFELWAETGTALDLGLYVPKNIKKAFIETIRAADQTYP